MEGDFLMSEKERERKSTLERAKRKELTSLKRRRGHATSEKRNQVADETRRRPDDLTCALATRDCRALLLPTHRRYAAQRARPGQKTQQHDAAHRRSGRNPKDLDRPGETQVVVACRVPGRPGVNRDSQRPLARYVVNGDDAREEGLAPRNGHFAVRRSRSDQMSVIGG